MNAFTQDALQIVAGRAARRAIPGKQQRYMSTFNCGKAKASRDLNGDKHSPFFKALRSLIGSTLSNPHVLVEEADALIEQECIRVASTELLQDRLVELDTMEHSYECAENQHTHATVRSLTPATARAAAEANVAENEIQRERAAILRELAERMERNIA